MPTPIYGHVRSYSEPSPQQLEKVKSRRRIVIAGAIAAILSLAIGFEQTAVRIGAGRAAVIWGLAIVAIAVLVVLRGFFLRVLAGTAAGIAIGATLGAIAALLCYCFPSLNGPMSWSLLFEFVSGPAVVCGYFGLCAGCLVGGFWTGDHF